MKIKIIGLLFLALASRFFPHEPNFSAVGAIALFSGFFFHSRKEAWLISLGALFVSDLWLGFYPGMLWVYLAFALSLELGRLLKKAPQQFWSPIIMANFGAALLFFVVSNFGVWVSGSLYPKNLEGLYQCYLAAIPFFRNTLNSQLIFGMTLFAAHKFLSLSIKHEKRA